MSDDGIYRGAMVEWKWGAVDLLPIWNDDPYRAMTANWSPTGGSCYAIQVAVRDWWEDFQWDEPYVSIVSSFGPYCEDDWNLIESDEPHIFNLHLHAWHAETEGDDATFEEVEAHKVLAPSLGIEPTQWGTCVIGTHNLYRATHMLFGLLDRGIYWERKMNQ